MFKQLASTYEGALQAFSPLAPIGKRCAWEGLDTSLKEELITHAQTLMEQPYPSLLASLFHLYTKTGNRIQYEEAYFMRRTKLGTLVLAECVENKGRFIEAIIDGIFVICEESGWHLPAHNSYERSSPSLPYPDSTRPILDLFAMETGALLATTLYLLESKLDALSPLIASRIRHELAYRIYTPYTTCHFWWMGKDDEPMNNWTIWCTQNMLLATFLLPQEDTLKHQVFTKACTSIDYFLKEYGEDGCCDEGPQYYRHAALCLFNTLEVLNGITNGHFNTVYHETKIQNMATYLLKVHVAGPYYINFADASPKAGPAGAREFLFGARINDAGLMSFAKQDYLQQDSHILPHEINLFYRLQSLFAHQQITQYEAQPWLPTDTFFPSNGLFIVRDHTYCLAVKTGDNDDSHNHNDTGSITLYKNGHPFLIDIGVENYTKKTFSSDRYSIWTMQSDFHNLPTINNTMQQAGPMYQATQVETYLGPDKSSISCDLASCYPPEAHIQHYLRTVTLHKGSHVSVIDHVSPAVPVITNWMTLEKPTLEGNVLSIGELGQILITSPFDHVYIESFPITDSRLQNAWPHTIYRIRIHFKGDTLSLTIH